MTLLRYCLMLPSQLKASWNFSISYRKNFVETLEIRKSQTFEKLYDRVDGVVLVYLLLTLNIFHTLF